MPLFASRAKTIVRAKGPKPVETSGDAMGRLQAYTNSLLAGDLRQSIQLPPGEDLNEWLAINTCEFLESAKTLYSLVESDCDASSEKCKVMNAGESWRYLWADGKTYKKPTEVSAPKYIELLFAWAQAQISDQALFPTEPGVPFPKTFLSVVKQMFKRFFRVYAHIYLCHFDVILKLGCEAHLNTCTRHFVLFVREFGLVDADDLEPLKPVIDMW